MGISLYKIKKWYKMLTGQSVSHVNQGVGTCFSKEEVASTAGWVEDFRRRLIGLSCLYSDSGVYNTCHPFPAKFMIA